MARRGPPGVDPLDPLGALDDSEKERIVVGAQQGKSNAVLASTILRPLAPPGRAPRVAGWRPDLTTDDTVITICSACLRAACWQGWFMCEGAQEGQA